jgi:PPOX class probable F420-dependent enzyme
VQPEDHEFLRTHGWALLATTRASGSPQVSLLAYHFDGDDIVISCRRKMAKVVNIRRDPRVVVAVVDGRSYVSVAGTAEIVLDEPRLHELTLRLQASLRPEDAAKLQKELDLGLERVGRAILRVVPERVVGMLDPP